MNFSKIRQWNRNKNYFLKKIKLKIVCFFLDKRKNNNFQLSGVKKVIILRDDNKIGDMIISTLLFRELNKCGLKVDVVSGKDNYCVIEYNNYIDNNYFLDNNFLDFITLAFKLRRKKFDLLIDLGDSLSPTYFSFVSIINAKHTLGFNKSEYKTYDLSISYNDFSAHITNRYKIVLDRLGVLKYELNYDIFIPDDIIISVNEFLDRNKNKPIIIINPYTANIKRDLTESQITDLINGINSEYPSVQIVLIGSPRKIIDLNIDGAIKNPFSTFLSSAALVKKAVLVISPDTSIVHVACAFNTKLISLYGNNIISGGFINNKVWAPNYANAVQIIAEDNNISSIPVDDILFYVRKKLDS